MILHHQGDEILSSDVHKIGDLFAFKVNVNSICGDLAIMTVKMNDEDVPGGPEMKMFKIRVSTI